MKEKEPKPFLGPDKGGDFGGISDTPKEQIKPGSSKENTDEDISKHIEQPHIPKGESENSTTEKVDTLDTEWFQEATKRGFERLKELIQNKEVFLETLHQFRYTSGSVHHSSMSENFFIVATLFDRGLEHIEDIKKHRNFLDGKNITILEYAGSEDGYDFPCADAFRKTGANYVGTDVTVENEEMYPADDEYGGEEVLNLNAVMPIEKLAGRSFEIIFSKDFFGIPTYFAARGERKATAQLEKEVIANFDKFIPPGGFHIIASFEHPVIDQQIIKEMGYDIIEIPRKYMGRLYWILRKKEASKRD